MPRIEIHPFDGDWEALRRLGYESWEAEYIQGSWPDLYTRVIWQYYIDSTQDRRLMVGAYLGKELVGFMANLPRKYRYRAREYSGMLSSLLAVSPRYPGTLGVMAAACLEGNAIFGADFTLFTLDKTHKLLRHARALQKDERCGIGSTHYLVIERTLVHAVDYEAIRVHERLNLAEHLGIKAWGANRPILPGRTHGCVRAVREGDLPEILSMTETVPDQDQLVRVYDLPTLKKRFFSPGLSQALGGTMVFETGGRVGGFISYSYYDMVNRRGAKPWAWVDLICWDGLKWSEKKSLLAGVWEECKQHGCIGILAWTRQRLSFLPFLAARFLPYPEAMNVQVAYLKDGIDLQGAKGVFEQVI